MHSLEQITADFVMPLGAACRPAEALRRNNLRFISSPFDWMMSYKLSTVIHFFRNDFDDFFNEAIDVTSKNAPHRAVKDVKNEILSLHHFSINKS
ncbi:MAG: hypothetical protein IJY48_04115, partial [Mailhella sp.]|nr:hypothetical protein [Mailhella sp.]